MDKEIYRYEITIEGTTPLMFHNPKSMELGENAADSEKVEAATYRNPATKNLAIPGAWLKGAVMGYRMKLAGKLWETEALENNPNIMIEEDMNDLGIKAPQVDERYIPVGRQSWKTKIKTVSKAIRPYVKSGWKCTFIVAVLADFPYTTKDDIEMAFNRAGKMLGIGANRKNNWGRFKVVDIKELE